MVSTRIPQIVNGLVLSRARSFNAAGVSLPAEAVTAGVETSPAVAQPFWVPSESESGAGVLVNVEPRPAPVQPAPVESRLVRLARAMLKADSDDKIEVAHAIFAWHARFLFSNPFRN